MTVPSWLASCALLGALSCSSSDAPPPQQATRHVALPAGVAAQVGNDAIALSTVLRIAQSQRVTPLAARGRAIDDALFAAGARAVFEGGSVVPTLERAVWARVLLEGLKAQAVARGPATDAEVATLTALRWQLYDRPESARTTHAVARVEKPERDATARAVAQKIWEAVQGIHDAQEFLRVAKAVPHPGIDVRVESLPAVTADGRVYTLEGSSSDRFDADFAAAANALAVGQIGQPKKSSFGYHVILCEERIPALHVPLEERRARLTEDIVNGRAERAKQELLEHASRVSPALVVRSVEDLTAQVRIGE